MGFSGWDWAVFVAALIASLGTGLAAGWVARRRTVRGDAKGTAAEFLMGGRTLNPLVVALSTMVGAVSAITLLGNAAEMYAFGTQLWMNHFGIVLGFVFVHLVNLKVLYPLRITSVFTYIEGRFQSKALRSFTTVFTFLGTFLYLGLCAYTPSLAMQTLTGLPTWASIVIMGGICTFYSAWGGVRAVVYTDMLQVLVMVVGVVVILVTAVMEVGGLGRVWEVARQHGRVELWNVDPNPLQRHSLWLVTVQGYFLPLVLFGTGQAQVQRVCSVATWNKAVGAHYLNLAVLLTVVSCCNLMGIAIFAVYATCDPLATGAIQKADQIVPFYVMDRLSSLYGVAGLFMASLYAGGLSTYSSQINGVAAVLWEGIFRDAACVAALREERRPLVNVAVSVVIGVAGMVSGLACTWVGGVFQAAQTILGTINAPLLGLFLLGMCCPFANKTAARLPPLPHLLHALPAHWRLHHGTRRRLYVSDLQAVDH
ncbi:sodium-coupled monocarboxylate transporter 1-like isoform X2 [Scylla paramamosain]|uniref:sodium-coupled monocarboxylate transporter 1-like isoform X2 n=1 Tax=Scylla paramamosain TaxID=85552 RepID=UPI0030832731